MPNMSRLGFAGIFLMSMKIFSRISVGLPSLKFLFLKETHKFLKVQMIMAIFLALMAANATNVVVIIFDLTYLDSDRPITVAMVEVEDLVGVVIFMVE